VFRGSSGWLGRALGCVAGGNSGTAGFGLICRQITNGQRGRLGRCPERSLNGPRALAWARKGWGREPERKPGPAFDLVFSRSAYDAAGEYAATLGLLGGSRPGLLGPGSLVIAEHRRKERLEDCYGSLERTRLLEQGDAALSFLCRRSNGLSVSITAP